MSKLAKNERHIRHQSGDQRHAAAAAAQKGQVRKIEQHRKKEGTKGTQSNDDERVSAVSDFKKGAQKDQMKDTISNRRDKNNARKKERSKQRD